MSQDTQKKSSSGAKVAAIRNRIAQLVWLFCLFCAVLLIVGALLIALKANRDNSLVMFVIDTADKVDLSVFDRRDGVFTFDDKKWHTREMKNALVNWGLAGIAWLIIGRVANRVIRG